MSETSSPVVIDPPKREASHHPEYYWAEGVIFLVEGTLFKVPRNMLEKYSTVFCDMFSIPSAEKQNEGLTDTTPIRLEWVKAVDFERLMRIVYPLIAADGYPCASWSVAEWTSILHLATFWEMDYIRGMALKFLDRVASSATKIKLGRKYDLPAWISEGFVDLCLRADPLTEDEARELELKDVVDCAATREKIRARVMEFDPASPRFAESTRHGHSWIRRGIYQDGVALRTNPYVWSLIEDTFGIELENPHVAPIAMHTV